ncbi:phosphocholine cytidylyltransferase family protein [Methylopila sp. M107]|uniref:phosphocholine cytidylyltransferase family protein n=1 Tax=Methylopila sp. M107 TaxID=1101190 RepID=UPI00037479B4|nr:phosphocholine cytidylyltransferase family protein [Methylopila sp. M107]
MKAIILSAGQGRRLLPLTAETPKCLIPFSGRPLVEWQVRALAQAGVDDVVVVTGFEAAKVDQALAAISLPGVRLRTTHNPFFELADNLASCWIARHEMRQPFMILNGDTMIEPEIAKRVLADPATSPITVTIDIKGDYDSDDMKVRAEGDRLLAIGKTLPAEIVTGESIGFLRFTDEGAKTFVAEIERLLRNEEGLKRWYLSAIDGIARYHQGEVGVRSIEGLDWSELDFPADLDRGIAMTEDWVKRGI